MMKLSDKVGVRVLTTAQAAKALGYSYRTLEDWRLKRKGPQYLKIAGKKNHEAFYLPKHLEEFAAVTDSRARVPSKAKKAKRK